MGMGFRLYDYRGGVTTDVTLEDVSIGTVALSVNAAMT
jgi:hypothetical protein